MSEDSERVVKMTRWDKNNDPPPGTDRLSCTGHYICLKGAYGAHKGQIRKWFQPYHPCEITKRPDISGTFVADFTDAGLARIAENFGVGKLFEGRTVSLEAYVNRLWLASRVEQVGVPEIKEVNSPGLVPQKESSTTAGYSGSPFNFHRYNLEPVPTSTNTASVSETMQLDQGENFIPDYREETESEVSLSTHKHKHRKHRKHKHRRDYCEILLLGREVYKELRVEYFAEHGVDAEGRTNRKETCVRYFQIL